MSFLDLNGLKQYTDKILDRIKNTSNVTSFNGRVGDVFPIIGDYSASMITGAVPETRSVNGKPLSNDITLTADDIEGLNAITPNLSEYVPISRMVNGKALSSDITLSASDIGAQVAGSYVPTTRSVNGIALSSDITLTASNVSALPISGGTLTGNLRIKNSKNYGTKLNLGDGDYVHISEPVDDHMEIKANAINFVLSDTTDSKFTINGVNPFENQQSGQSEGKNVVWGYYIGNGKHGSEANACSVSAASPISFIFMVGRINTTIALTHSFAVLSEVSTSYGKLPAIAEFYEWNGNYRADTYGKMSSDRKTFYWYVIPKDNIGDVSSAELQWNLNGVKYYYMLGLE